MIRPTPTGVRLTIRLIPKASRDQVQRIHGDAIRIAVTSPPVDGKANAHLIKFLAKRLGVPKGAVTIASGELARDKVVDVSGISEADARERLLGG